MGVTAVILAGGRATRMQGEKPLRLLKGRTLLQHTKDLVEPLADEILVASGTRVMDLPPGTRNVPDDEKYAGEGPLAGILAGLETAANDRVLIIACDLPNLPTALMQRLLGSLASDCHCCWCEHSGHPEPLAAAVLRAPAQETVRKALEEAQNKVIPCWRSMSHMVLGESDLTEFAPLKQAFSNINTLADLERQQNSEPRS